MRGQVSFMRGVLLFVEGLRADRLVFPAQLFRPVSQPVTLHRARSFDRHAPDRVTGGAVKHRVIECGNVVEASGVGAAAKATRQEWGWASHVTPLVKLLRREEVADRGRPLERRDPSTAGAPALIFLRGHSCTSRGAHADKLPRAYFRQKELPRMSG